MSVAEQPLAAPARGLARVASGLGLMALVELAAAVLAPRIPSFEAAPLVEFAVASGTAIAALGLAASAPAAKLPALAVGAAGALTLAALSFVPFSMTGVVLVAVALVALGWSIGASIGSRVQDPGHLLPACIVAACADVVSTVSPSGPTHAIVENARALSLLAVSFPVFGTRDAEPILGGGDLVFVGLLLGAARAHRLPYLRMVALAFAGALGAAGLSAAFGAAVPALPTIAFATILGVPRVRVLARKDRAPAQVFVVLAVTAALATIASRLGWVPGAPPAQ